MNKLMTRKEWLKYLESSISIIYAEIKSETKNIMVMKECAYSIVDAYEADEIPTVQEMKAFKKALRKLK